MKIGVDLSTWIKHYEGILKVPLRAPENGYIRFRCGKVSRTIPILPGCMCADFDARGMLLGIEIIGLNKPMLNDGKRRKQEPRSAE